MFTDGIPESRRLAAEWTDPAQRLEFFGPDGALAVSREGAIQGLDPIGRAILEAARAFTGGSLKDDVCLLLARRR
jgi:serine phosphatase RsbU (regulator of sigma subunit)